MFNEISLSSSAQPQWAVILLFVPFFTRFQLQFYMSYNWERDSTSFYRIYGATTITTTTVMTGCCCSVHWKSIQSNNNNKIIVCGKISHSYSTNMLVLLDIFKLLLVVKNYNIFRNIFLIKSSSYSHKLYHTLLLI